MVADRLGRTVSTGAVYVIAGEVRAIDKPRAGMLAIVSGTKVLQVDAADVVRIDDAAPREIALSASGKNTGASATEIFLSVDDINVKQGEGCLIPFVRDCSLIGMAADVSHTNGSDPGDWTVTAIKRDDSGTNLGEETLTCTMDNSGFANHNISREVYSSPMGFTAGTHLLEVLCTGPACATPRVHVVVLLRIDP